MDFGEKPRKHVTINITSLVDILIVLLLFFMLTTQFIHMEILNVNFSDTTEIGTNNSEDNQSVIITLTGNNKFILDGNEFSLIQLQEKVKPLIDKNPTTDITLLSKQETIVQDIVTAIDSIKAVGGINVSVAEDENAGK